MNLTGKYNYMNPNEDENEDGGKVNDNGNGHNDGDDGNDNDHNHDHYHDHQDHQRNWGTRWTTTNEGSGRVGGAPTARPLGMCPLPVNQANHCMDRPRRQHRPWPNGQAVLWTVRTTPQRAHSAPRLFHLANTRRHVN